MFKIWELLDYNMNCWVSLSSRMALAFLQGNTWLALRWDGPMRGAIL